MGMDFPIKQKLARLKKSVALTLILGLGGSLFDFFIESPFWNQPSGQLEIECHQKNYVLPCDIQEQQIKSGKDTSLKPSERSIIQLSINQEKKCYYQGEKISVSVKINNNSSIPYYTEKENTIDFNKIPSGKLTFILNNELGQTVPLLVNSPLSQFYIPQRKSIFPEIIRSLSYNEYEIFLNCLFDLTQPGIYSFQMKQEIRSEDQSRIQLISNQIQFRIIEDHLIPRYGQPSSITVDYPLSGGKPEKLTLSYCLYLRPIAESVEEGDPMFFELFFLNPIKSVNNLQDLRVIFGLLEFEVISTDGKRIRPTWYFLNLKKDLPPNIIVQEPDLTLPPLGSISIRLQIDKYYKLRNPGTYFIKAHLKLRPQELERTEVISNQVKFEVRARSWL